MFIGYLIIIYCEVVFEIKSLLLLDVNGLGSCQGGSVVVQWVVQVGIVVLLFGIMRFQWWVWVGLEVFRSEMDRLVFVGIIWQWLWFLYQQYRVFFFRWGYGDGCVVIFGMRRDLGKVGFFLVLLESVCFMGICSDLDYLSSGFSLFLYQWFLRRVFLVSQVGFFYVAELVVDGVWWVFFVEGQVVNIFGFLGYKGCFNT